MQQRSTGYVIDDRFPGRSRPNQELRIKALAGVALFGNLGKRNLIRIDGITSMKYSLVERRSAMNDTSDRRANHAYDIVEHRMNRPKRWALMAFFWTVAPHFGSATPMPSTKAWAILWKSDRKVVSTVDDEMAGEVNVRPQLDADLQSLTQAEFELAWGISQDLRVLGGLVASLGYVLGRALQPDRCVIHNTFAIQSPNR